MPRGRQSSTPEVRITAAICLDGEDDAAAAAVDSLIGQSLPRDRYEIVLIGGTPSPLAGHLVGVPNLRCVERPAEPGSARRLALEVAQAPFVAFLDPRAVAEPGWLASFCRTFAQFGDAAQAIGGRVRPRWATPRPDWLADELLAELSLVDLGEEARPLGAGERIAGVNIAYRKAGVNGGGKLHRLGGCSFAASAANESGLAFLDEISTAAGGQVYDPLAAAEFLVPADWLTQEWLRRKAAWRAVADFARAAPANAAEVAERWRAVKNFFFECPPTERTVRGLVLRQDDPRRFRQQISAVYDSTYCLLAGIGENEYD